MGADGATTARPTSPAMGSSPPRSGTEPAGTPTRNSIGMSSWPTPPGGLTASGAPSTVLASIRWLGSPGSCSNLSYATISPLPSACDGRSPATGSPRSSTFPSACSSSSRSAVSTSIWRWRRTAGRPHGRPRSRRTPPARPRNSPTPHPSCGCVGNEKRRRRPSSTPATPRPPFIGRDVSRTSRRSRTSSSDRSASPTDRAPSPRPTPCCT